MKSLIRKIPLIGVLLVDVRFRNHVEAIQEVGLNIVLSTIPIWFGAVIMLAFKNVQGNWFDLVIGNVYKGELFIYATAILGPLYYFMFKEYKNFPQFPSARSFMLSALFIIVFSVGLFAVQRIGGIFLGQVSLNQDFIFSLSWKIYLFSVAIVYLAHVYKNLVETGAPHLGATDTHEFVDNYINRHQG